MFGDLQVAFPTPDEWVAFFTLVLAVSTVLLWDATRKLWRASKEQSRDFLRSVVAAEEGVKAALAAVDVATEANGIARESLWADQRPWMLIQDVRIATPLTWDGGNIRLSFVFSLSNSGRTPAEAVDIQPLLFLSFPDFPTDALKEILDRPATVFGGKTYHSNEASPLGTNVLLSTADIAQWHEKRRAHWPDSPEGRHFPMHLIGVVAYRAPLSGIIHRTAFAFDVSYQQPQMGIPIDIGDIPIEDLILSRHFLGDILYR